MTQGLLFGLIETCFSITTLHGAVHSCLTNVRQLCIGGRDGGLGARTRSRGKDPQRFPRRLVAYERVSMARQGACGLGLEAQRKSNEDFAVSRGVEVLARFSEVESGRKAADRPELAKTLHLAKVTGATLVIAKLDRLGRNAAFLLALRDGGVRFVAVDMPEANDLTVGIMAPVAQAEREAISRCTKEA
jgi:hypothetical protein